MAMFEAATIIRAAPWFTVSIFVWSFLSGLLGGHLPTLHSTGQQPIRLQHPQPPAWPDRHRQELIMGPEHVQHEGRVLADETFQPGLTTLHKDTAALQADSFLTDSSGDSPSEQSEVFTGSDLKEHDGDEWSRSQFTQTADLIAHNREQADALSKLASTDSDLEPSQEAFQLAYKSAPESLGHAADHSASATVTHDPITEATNEAGSDPVRHAAAYADINTGVDSFDPHHMHATERLGYSEGKDILGLLGLPTDLVKERHYPDSLPDDSKAAPHVLSHTPSHMSNHPHGDHNVLHPGNPPASATCFIHQDLPIPGMDIAPADKDRCYAHPPEYKNKNYLNDSYYMLYHHDIPTSHPHPAFSWGDLSRLAQVSHKMRRNDPVTVTFVGGSVSSSYCQNPSVTCWVAPVSDWLREQNPQVQIINNAVGGTTSRTTAECFDAMVGKDADLIFLEYSYNDRFGIDPAQQQQGYELLVRKLLKLPHQPAVIVVHWWGPKHDCLTLVSKEEAEARSPDHSHHQCAMTLWNSTEDQIQNIVHRYGVQSISFRNAYRAEIDAEVDGFLPEQTLMPDLIHPSMRGVKLLGNLVIRFLSDANAYTAKHDHAIKMMTQVMPKPLFIDPALDELSNTCTRGNALQDMKMHTVDWYWVDGKKPGFQTDVPGASLVLMVMLPEDLQVDKLSLGYLASYENMGWAQVECLGACSCPVLKIDANSTARASQEHFAAFSVEKQETGDGCVLKVTTLYMSSAVNGGHKFKVSSVAWSSGGSDSATHSVSQHGVKAKTDLFEVDQVMSLGSD